MNIPVLTLSFVGAVALFAAWLVYLLRIEHARSQPLLEPARAVRLVRPTTAEPSRIVRAGAFCRVPGNVGHSNRGVLMVCSSEPAGRPRWRQADRLSRAS
jgi:hypothetical protein